MPKGKGYKASMKKTVSKSKSSPRSYSLPSGRVSGKGSKGKFNVGLYKRTHAKVFGLAKKEQMGKM